MSLSKKELDELLRLVNCTEENEIDCEKCLSLVAEFAEQRLEGKSLSDALKAVEQHLAVCTECCEEYDALKRVLSAAEK